MILTSKINNFVEEQKIYFIFSYSNKKLRSLSCCHCLLLFLGRRGVHRLLVVYLSFRLQLPCLLHTLLAGLDHALVETFVFLFDHHHSQAILLVLHVLCDSILVYDLGFAQKNLKMIWGMLRTRLVGP